MANFENHLKPVTRQELNVRKLLGVLIALAAGIAYELVLLSVS
jgi:hypothetical protein